MRPSSQVCRSGLLPSSRWGLKQSLRRLQRGGFRKLSYVPRGGSADGDVPPRFIGSPERHRLITYITDIEGDREYLTRYVRQSRVLRFKNSTIPGGDGGGLPYDHCVDFARPHDILVFGGDIWDQGGHDLYVIRQLLDLKRRYPDRVYFVLGNRDINKMRIHAELGATKEVMVPHHPGVHWLRGSQKQGDPELDNTELCDPVERLKFILRGTMGSPRAFEYRRSELEEEKSRPVPDEEVVESYRTSCHPNGEMGQYLANAHLAVRLGNILFVHGSLPLTKDVLTDNGDPNRLWEGDLRFAMPWLAPHADHNVNSTTDWIDALNNFSAREIQEWRNSPPIGPPLWCSVGGYHGLPDEMRAGAQVMQYGMGWLPDGTRNPTVVYASWCNNGMPRRFFPGAEDPSFAQATKSFFQSSGLSLICSGHQPQGDMPNVICVPLEDDSNAWILCADTSYSGDVLWHNEDVTAPGRQGSFSGRGRHAVCEVLLTLDMDTENVVEAICHGVLSDGTKYETKPLPWNRAETEDSAHRVGCLARGAGVPGGTWWTRASFTNGSRLLVSGEGYDAWNFIKDDQEYNQTISDNSSHSYRSVNDTASNVGTKRNTIKTSFSRSLCLLLLYACLPHQVCCFVSVAGRLLCRSSAFFHRLQHSSIAALKNDHGVYLHHAAVRTRNITTAVQFYSLLGFEMDCRFRAGPARAAWLSLIAGNTTTTAARLEIIEVPKYILNEPEGMRRRAPDLLENAQELGLNHIALDVTQQIHNLELQNLSDWMDWLNAKSQKRFGRDLRIAVPPRQQMIGRGVYELAFIYDADGSLVELMHEKDEVSQTMESGWDPWDGEGFVGRED